MFVAFIHIMTFLVVMCIPIVFVMVSVIVVVVVVIISRFLDKSGEDVRVGHTYGVSGLAFALLVLFISIQFMFLRVVRLTPETETT